MGAILSSALEEEHLIWRHVVTWLEKESTLHPSSTKRNEQEDTALNSGFSGSIPPTQASLEHSGHQEEDGTEDQKYSTLF